MFPYRVDDLQSGSANVPMKQGHKRDIIKSIKSFHQKYFSCDKADTERHFNLIIN